MSQENCLSDPRWRQPVFVVANREYDWLDVLIAAMVRGDWSVFEGRLRDGLARQHDAANAVGWPADDSIDAAATAFRTSRDLISRAETLAWLDHRGIDLDAWTGYLVRQLLMADGTVSASRNGGSAAGVAAVFVDAAALAAEGFCSGAFDRFARTLAARVAVAAASPAPAGGDVDDGAMRDAMRARHAKWLGESAPADTAARLSSVLAIEHRYHAVSRAAIVPGALAAQAAQHPIAWMRIDMVRLSFPWIDAAREARWCVEGDGLSLEMVASRAGAPLRDDRLLLEQLEAAWQPAVLGAATDELLGPIAVNGGFELATVAAKAAPDLSDGMVRARAARAVVEALESASIRDAVRWVDRR